MCTVTFIPIGNGYLLGMNRDEKIARGAGDPPRVRHFELTPAIFPSDNGGGTWIASNCYGITLALLNWNIPVVLPSRRRSRGLIIPRLISSTSSAELNHALATQQVANCAPFRLVAVVPGERNVAQWNWDGDSRGHRHFRSTSLQRPWPERRPGLHGMVRLPWS